MNKILILLCGAALFASCKKSQEDLKALSSYTVINATTDLTNVRAYVANHEIAWKTVPITDAAAQYRSATFGAFAGLNHVLAVNGADTTKVLFKSTKPGDFKTATFNNLFIYGNATAGYEGMLLMNDNIVNHTDSVIGIRYINLVPNSTPLNITLSTSSTTNEVSALAYKQKSDFKNYPALISTTTMVLQVRDETNVLLASYTLPVFGTGTYATAGIANGRFKNITMVIKGLQGTTSGTNALGIFPVVHY